MKKLVILKNKEFWTNSMYNKKLEDFGILLAKINGIYFIAELFKKLFLPKW